MPCRLLRFALLVAFIAAALWATADWRSVVFAQNVRPAPAAPRPARPQPAIDPLTASIHGRVTTADSGAPIRRAEVRAMANSGGISRLATTDGDGRFELRDMPAGQYRLTVTKSGFVPLTFGQRRPLEAARPIDLETGERVTANVALPRAGAITGRVYDHAGEGLADVRVQALRSRVSEGRRRLEPIGPADRTDDTGSFRLYGLPPGGYYVTASPQRRTEIVPMGAPLRPDMPPNDARAMTTFYPGTPSLEQATPVPLGAGTEARADIQIGDVPGATVSGMVFSSSGAPADATLTLRSESITLGVSAVISGPPPLMISGHTNGDGTFTIANVPPGSFTLTATLRPFLPGFAMTRTTSGNTALINLATGQVQPAPNPLTPETAALPLVVTGADVAGLSITTGTGGSVEGTFVADAGVTQPLPGNLGVTARSLWGSESMMRFGGGHTFRLAGLNGIATIAVDGLPEGWAVKSIVVDGVDRTDEPLDFRNGQQAAARIVLTDRITVVTGTVAGDGPLRDAEERAHHTVVVFPDDAKKWTYPSRYVRSARTDEQGAFRISGLPADERYLAVAVDFVEDGEWTDPEFLERARTGATTFSLSEGERRAIDVRLVRR
jgi:hypothetical protein